jgi:hypothetical protein
MGLTEDLADALARDTIAAMDELGDDTLVAQVSKILASSSIAGQEAFMASVRVIQAERRARAFLAERRRQAGKDGAA